MGGGAVGRCGVLVGSLAVRGRSDRLGTHGGLGLTDRLVRGRAAATEERERRAGRYRRRLWLWLWLWLEFGRLDLRFGVGEALGGKMRVEFGKTLLDPVCGRRRGGWVRLRLDHGFGHDFGVGNRCGLGRRLRGGFRRV